MQQRDRISFFFLIKHTIGKVLRLRVHLPDATMEYCSIWLEMGFISEEICAKNLVVVAGVEE